MPRRDAERGFALLAVLAAAAIMAIIVASLLTTGRSDAAIARGRMRAASLEATTDAAINDAILRMCGRDARLRPATDGTDAAVVVGGVPVRVSVQDEAGKVDLNTASGELLGRLLQIGGLGAEDALIMAERIQDWREPGDLHRTDGGAAADYRAAGSFYGPRRGPFPDVAELRLVLGMDPRVFARIAASLTVTSGTPWVDPGYAPRDVLLTLPGASASSVAATLAARTASARPGVVVGHAFTIDAEANEAGTRMIRRAVIRLTGNDVAPVWVYSWARVTEP